VKKEEIERKGKTFLCHLQVPDLKQHKVGPSWLFPFQL